MDKERLDEIVDLMLETVCSARKTLRIAGDDYPAELVKSKFLKLNSSHIEFVMDCMRENTTKIRNIKQYLRAVLFNAPSTIDNYYTALVAHDMASPDWGKPKSGILDYSCSPDESLHEKAGACLAECISARQAPQEWKDREQLWNAVEEVETAKGSRLAREFVVALPIELNRAEQIELLQEFIRKQFVSDGMCADAAIHDTDGHNPHAHILLSVRSLDEQGKWQYKIEKE